MTITAQEREIIREIHNLANKGTTCMLPEVVEAPVTRYTDPKQLEQEIDILFGEFPIIIGHASDLAEAGDFLTQDIAGKSVLVTRARDGQLRAFLNVCRHRGAKVEGRSCGKASTFSCPYHAWTYDLEGKFRGMPQPDGFQSLQREDLGLVELSAYEHFGLIWVIPSRTREKVDIQAWTADFQEYLEGLDLGNHYVYKKWALNRDMSWRIALEGFQESYHFCAAHRETACSSYLNNQSVHLNFNPHVRHAVPLPKVLELESQDPDTWQYRPNFMDQNYLFPANFVQVMTDHVYVHTIIPTGPGTCVFQCMMLVPEKPKTDKAEKYWQKNYDLIRIVFDEDFQIGENIQRGLNSGANEHFVFGRYECGLHFGHAAINEALEGKLVAPSL